MTYIALEEVGDYYRIRKFLGAYDSLSEAIEKIEDKVGNRKVEKWEGGECIQTITID